MSDGELLAENPPAAGTERENLERMLRRLAEIEKRRLHVVEGYYSLFDYCKGALGLCDSESWRRVQCSRAGAKYPALFAEIGRGELFASSLAALARHLTDENWRSLTEKARGLNRREIEALIASMIGVTERVDHVRYLAAPPGVGDPGEETAKRIEISFSGGEELLKKLERAQELIRPRLPGARFGDIFSAALDAWLDKHDPDRRHRKKDREQGCDDAPAGPVKAEGPRLPKRRLSKRVQDAVFQRDGGRCTYLSPSGRRCEARAALEFDHIVPFALGGSGKAENIRLRCRAHNQLAAREAFGPGFMDAAIAKEAHPGG